MDKSSLPPASLRLLLADAASRDLPTARRCRLFRILYHERYLTRAQLIVRVEAHLGRGCFGASAWKDTFFRDMRLVKQAFAAAGYELRYSRDPQRPGYYLQDQPPISAELKSRNAGALAELDAWQLALLRRLTPCERVEIGCSMSQSAIDVVTYRNQQRNQLLSRQEAQIMALKQYYQANTTYE